MRHRIVEALGILWAIAHLATGPQLAGDEAVPPLPDTLVCAMRADRIWWNGQQYELENMSAQTRLAALRAERGIFKINASASGQSELEFTGSIRASGPMPPSWTALPLSPKRWELETSRANLAFDAAKHFHHVDLAAIKVRAILDEGAEVPWGTLTAAQAQWQSPMKGSLRDCQVHIERLAPPIDTPSLWDCHDIKGKCLRVECDAHSVRMFPQIELQSSSGSLSHLGLIETRWQPTTLDPRKGETARASEHFDIRGWGTSHAEYRSASPTCEVELEIPGRFYLNGQSALLKLWADSGRCFCLTWREPARQLELFGRCAQVSSAQSGPPGPLGPQEAFISGDVALSCVESRGKAPTRHQISADALTLAARSLTFEANRGNLVRYTSDQNGLSISAKTLIAEFPTTQHLKIRGLGVVQTRLQGDLPFLRNPKKSFGLR